MYLLFPSSDGILNVFFLQENLRNLTGMIQMKERKHPALIGSSLLVVQEEFRRGVYDSQVMNLSCQGSRGLLAPAGLIPREGEKNRCVI